MAWVVLHTKMQLRYYCIVSCTGGDEICEKELGAGVHKGKISF